jgi:hypothetical protein
MGDWRNFHNEELHNLYAPSTIIRVIKTMRMRWVGHEARMRDLRNAYTFSVRKTWKKEPLGRRRHRWQKNIRMDLIQTG